jgi:L-histidine N-alpha-methyltransferase
MPAPAYDHSFASDVRAGLAGGSQKTLPCQYFYDEVGSALFEAITTLPEYGLTRADARVLQAHAGDLIEMLPANLMVAELGSGTGIKTRPILEQIGKQRTAIYCPIDVSGSALDKCALEMSSVAKVFPQEATYLEGLRAAGERRAAGQTLLLLFLGSTIGNFEPEAAIDFLYAVRQSLHPGDALLLGTDMIKPVERLIAAYDDPTGVNAAFNLNLLARINRELDADFNLRRFEHVIRYEPALQRIEMHLRSRVHQVVKVRKAELMVEFAAGETICTESCHKFRPEQICEMARACGFRLAAQWVDEEWPFAENLLMAV